LPVTGGESVKIETYRVEYVSRIRNEHVELKKRDHSYLQGLWFSVVCKKNEVLEIEVLIGADYLWCFQEGNSGSVNKVRLGTVWSYEGKC
jgi:hypothetical protein